MRILVTGATGSVGRLVVDQLVEAGGAEVRALTTDPAKAALPDGVEVVTGYVGRPESMIAALEGVDRVYLAPVPRTAEEVLSMAQRAGVERVVDLSGKEGGPWHAVSTAVEASGLEWTHLMPREFMDNTLMWSAQIRETGVVRDAFPTSANAPIDLRDIAAVAATALLEDSHVGQSYRMTGPRSITLLEKVEAIGEAVGRTIRFEELDADEAIAQHQPLLGDTARWYVRNRGELADKPDTALPTVAEVTGRPGTTFDRWAVDHAAAFRPAA